EAVDPDGQGQPAWDIWAAGQSSSSGWCCYTGSAVSLTFNSAGVYRIGVQAIDRARDVSQRQSTMVSIGGATGIPPIARATLDRLGGSVPLTVNIDMSASSDDDGIIQYYFMNCGRGGFTPGSGAPTATCTYTTPGIYWLLLQVQDNSGQMDLVSTYVVATPQNGGGGVPPPPTGLTATAGDAQVTLSWTGSAGATSYNVKRATVSGGPYTTVATTSLTSFVNIGLTNNTTYYYVVSGINPAGEGANSTQVSATPKALTWQSLTLSASKIKSGTTLTAGGTVTVAPAAPAGGQMVILSSSNPSILAVPPSVTVAEWATSATFTITASATNKNVNMKVTATLGGVSKQQTILVTP